MCEAVVVQSDFVMVAVLFRQKCMHTISMNLNGLSFVCLTLFPYFSFFLVHTTSYIYGTAYDFMINYQVYHHLSQRTTLNRLSFIDSFLFSRTISISWRSQFSNVIHDLVAKVCTIILSVWWIVIMIIAPSKRNVNKS